MRELGIPASHASNVSSSKNAVTSNQPIMKYYYVSITAVAKLSTPERKRPMLSERQLD